VLLHDLFAMIFDVNHATVEVPCIVVKALESIGEDIGHIEAFDILANDFTLRRYCVRLHFEFVKFVIETGGELVKALFGIFRHRRKFSEEFIFL